jgi:peptide/nickel transport system substrate-binding protein
LGRYLRWQAAIALLGIVLLVALLRYAAYSFTSVTVPDQGGSFVEGVAGNPRYLNPLLSQYNQIDEEICALLFSGLTRLDEQGNVVPDLAETFTVSSDGLVYDFRLRPGLTWHDGAPVRAADVLHTVGVMQSPDFPGVPWLGTLWRAAKTSAPEGEDGLAVRFELEQPLAPFLDYTTIGLLPAHLWERVPIAQMMESQLNTQPVGTGPFQLSDISATQVDLVPFARYYGDTPYLAHVIFRFYPAHQNLLAAFDRKEIDGVSWVWPDEMEEASRRNDLQLFSAPLSGYTLIYLNLRNPNLPFFSEDAVRQALLLGLDRQALIDDVLHGQGIVAHTPILPGTWAHDSEATQYGHDPERARQLLDAAGWRDTDGDGVRDRDGQKLAFILIGDERNMLEAVSTAWAKIGVQAAAQPVTLAGLTSDFLATRTFDAALVHWELSGDPDPYPLWHSTQIQDGQNYAGWDDEATDVAIEQARALTDVNLRRDYYVEFQRIFAERLPALLLYHPVYTYGVRNIVHDVQLGPLNTSADRFRNISQWYIKGRRITVGN